ncbi:hypothetical protein [Empedobacter tilapiae]|uniref:Uncharacterized protein n=1 Tax=Empedobacter tilapiae TaxID=2491114 RepID=A0A4Z1B599_9FLAO|nr:hypothetical protein [Empedobacter tilapiae]TGN26076.1 hypothetical protein E4J94_12025 [Empedobacter tilapiae]
MIPEKEINILGRIDYANKFLHIREKYIGEGKSFWLFKKSDILKAFKTLGYDIQYVADGTYVIDRNKRNHRFEYRFVISKNNFNVYMYIYVNDILLEERISNTGSFLRYLNFNPDIAEKINENGFVLDSLDRLTNYIQDVIGLLDEFINEY